MSYNIVVAIQNRPKTLDPKRYETSSSKKILPLWQVFILAVDDCLAGGCDNLYFWLDVRSHVRSGRYRYSRMARHILCYLLCFFFDGWFDVLDTAITKA